MTSMFKKGDRIHSLTVLDDFVCVRLRHGTKYKALCQCDCGHKDYYYVDALKRRKVDYCANCRPSGVRNTKLYHIYHGILQRCFNSSNPSYVKYGGRGISVCDEWRSSYDSFRMWALENGYREGLTIDRIDSDGNYEPDNCRWITLNENSARANRNRQKNYTKLTNVMASHQNGDTIIISNIAKFCRDNGLNVSNVNAALRGRISPYYNGWHFTCDQQGTCNDYRKTVAEETSAVRIK